MSKRKILFVVNNFNIGGPQKSLLSLLYKINYDIYDINLIVLNENGVLQEYLPEEVNILPTPSEIKNAIISPKNFIKDTVKMFYSYPKKAINRLAVVLSGVIKKDMTKKKQSYWVKVREELPKLDTEFDVSIGVSGGHSMMYIADCVSSKKKIGWIRSDYRVLNRDYEIDRTYFNRMDSIFSVSEMCKDIFIEIFPEAAQKVEVMYNVLPFEMYKNIPADTNLIGENENVFKLLTICRLDPYKGLDLAIGALEILLEKHKNIIWYILGDGKYRNELEKIISDRSLQNHFVLLGFQINTAEFIEKADILVHPSRFEGKSNAVDEAKYLLKPVVVTNYETAKEQINHMENGLISNMDSESLAESIKALITNKDLRTKFHDTLFSERYDDKKSIDTFYKVIN